MRQRLAALRVPDRPRPAHRDGRTAGRWAVFDVDAPALLPAVDMPPRITALLAAEGLREPNPAETVRSILESLAVAYAQTLDDAERLSGQPVRVVNLVGGASQNALLCRLISHRSGRPVLAGPIEATAIGNILVQARGAGLADGELEDLRCRRSRDLPGPRETCLRQIAIQPCHP